jgi:histidine triad (HIT) family protein
VSDCIFCKIIAGDIPSTKYYEDDQFLAFMDINPLTRGHSLLIPKAHHATIHDMPEELLQALILRAQRLSKVLVDGLGAKGINLMQSNGRAANQIIDHFHMHLIPRYEPMDIKGMAWELIPGDMEDIAKAADEIKAAL